MHPLEPAVRALATTGLARSPGVAFEYSNLNYTTLGLVVEMAAGEPLDAYLKTPRLMTCMRRWTGCWHRKARSRRNLPGGTCARRDRDV